MSFIASFYAGTHITQSQYPEDFAPVQFTSTKDRHGSVYIYRLLNRPCVILPNSMRHQSLPSFTTVFTGCVQSIICDEDPSKLIHARLGLPEDYNEAALALIAAQEAFLRRISDVDTMESRMTCMPLWGAPTQQYRDPMVVISIPKVKRIGMKMFKEGDDITVSVRVKRVDRVYGDVCVLGYILEGVSVHSGQSTMSLSLRGFASETDSTALANAVHHRDFAATRDRTLSFTSHFSYKSTVLEVSPTRSTRGVLVPYMPYLFGRVDWIGVTFDRMPIVKVVCPVAATCSIRRVYDKQVAVLKQILDDDAGDLGDCHIVSWFNPDGVDIAGNTENDGYRRRRRDGKPGD
ncbi:hypothetical protein B0H13DRAFT_2389340 [Mycena leptocephala]|nr:hypothetical protein B0H13DRAFT_2389340 [Mycena leptocephala]